MAYEKLNLFTDWLWNRFVEDRRKGKQTEWLYINALEKYKETVLSSGKFMSQRAHAKATLQLMNFAATHSSDKPELRGIERNVELYVEQMKSEGFK